MNDTLANHPWLYPALLHLHRSCVATSIGLFFARGLGVSFLRTWPMQAFCRYLSVAIDVALLSTGLSLLIILSYNPLQQAWLSVKLALLVLYIMLGTLALKRGRTRVQRLVFFMAALAVALTIVGIALARHPAGWWR